MGSTYLRGQIWWIKYYRNGRAMRETSRSGRQSDAKKLLAIREGDIARGLPIGPRQARITVAELLEDVKLDYKPQKVLRRSGNPVSIAPPSLLRNVSRLERHDR